VWHTLFFNHLCLEFKHASQPNQKKHFMQITLHASHANRTFTRKSHFRSQSHFVCNRTISIPSNRTLSLLCHTISITIWSNLLLNSIHSQSQTLRRLWEIEAQLANSHDLNCKLWNWISQPQLTSARFVSPVSHFCPPSLPTVISLF
jgi:hypothetical protein